ncbi:2-amino-4-hydroxy-6-hydroxymethyldihydropteridine pyrophosphokinase [Helicobacter bilis]|uniref:2-amino-4-hydroxy-6-hydroxymethyldihydropteridine pyrophosphokinase n=1 Tax=Helicobacter bilis TaxID=37372 RepID=A0A4U8UCP8_9HELI|nr:2-amino-4-hydroxy-6-hydroxymethyldihydropteridine pyrophosphokinase [Helicobacter bilis]MCI7412028.1 2-amino-4-hydroxy-6-hydroxymethyldihydropteridine pyrophosphokinase [Helicobacter bilis]MDD7297401.1 2-amino-4-hydroxy-6-hydroxymethyldihydropteridine pyrophosphokinase [Helicobacter bilis]MDY4399854.1 2-amino-4-hydroxy-6-hydroxymethyldihydropteridine pyrophosphokinase [Helicobacter bilis]TLE12203.1 2-amino-4-hydroxy-6-hydroxymethyldihydropteridine pyrophosphokinase [Helicobacter bilis]
MKGKVLTPSLISGEDGNRYTFEISDVSNLEGRSVENLTGCEVDFEVSEKAAKNIFITGGSINMANIQGQLMANDTQSIRFKFLLSIGLYFGGSFISIIPFIGWVIGGILLIAGFVVFVLAVLGTKRTSESPTLFKNFILSIAIVVVALILAMIFGGSALLGALAGYGSSGGFGLVVAAILLIVGSIAALVYNLLFFRELAFVTGQKFLLWGLYANIIGGITALIFIGWLFVLAALVLWIIGFYQMKTIRKRTASDSMPWF